jgi:alpha 1,3-glucosidase
MEDGYRDVARDAIVDRYLLLPYWYTLARRANLTGEPMVRPLWWEFTDPMLVDIDERAMLGSSLIVCPFLEEKHEEVTTIGLPNGARWFDYRSLQEIRGGVAQVPFDGGRTPVFIRGGYMVPCRRRIRRSSTLMFWDPMILTIAVDVQGRSEGELYVDDGESFNYATGSFIHKRYAFDGKQLVASDLFVPRDNAFLQRYDVKYEQIKIAGLTKPPTKITGPNGNLDFEVKGDVLVIHRAGLLLRDNFVVSFEY